MPRETDAVLAGPTALAALATPRETATARLRNVVSTRPVQHVGIRVASGATRRSGVAYETGWGTTGDHTGVSAPGRCDGWSQCGGAPGSSPAIRTRVIRPKSLSTVSRTSV